MGAPPFALAFAYTVIHCSLTLPMIIKQVRDKLNELNSTATVTHFFMSANISDSETNPPNI